MRQWQWIATIIAVLILTGSVTPMHAMDRKYIFFPDPTLHANPNAAGLTFEEVYFPAADGVRLHGWFLPGKTGRPLLLFAHGNAGNISHRIDNLAHFHRLGLSVFIFDYRGYGQSEGQISEVGSYEDIRGALAWLKSKGWTPKQMLYFGRSLGAAVALQLALEEPPAGLVLESAFTSVPRMGWHHQPITYALLGWWALSSRYDNLAKIGQLQCPLLMFQGTRDTIVPPKMAQQLFDRAPEPKTLYLIPDAGHNNTYDVGGKPYWEQWRSFLNSLTFPPR
ncbi:hydrolase, putative [Syntrophotalea carbinolica DSM 2380]|uniref:Hydrolase, putative n=1 Tax=Syntrophotalea carbinolica (strain DSM 2380 / NBRC 103641 / GraBd1) TaxID=338963 RepID=Q3A1U4_SYNC1|nr:alpha/beta hydrolase [Syntrophotalea carbinolica]ABA89663.1 hydrolase, putative [Syntrophotalea carbinolica DSM 2380]